MANHRSLELPALDFDGLRLADLERRRTTVKRASGLRVPRLFRAGRFTLTVDLPPEWLGPAVSRRTESNLSYALRYLYRPRRLHRIFRPQDEYMDAYEHAAIERSCGEAGKRAKDLLFSHLNDRQREQAEKEMYFDVVIFKENEHWVAESTQAMIYKEDALLEQLLREWEVAYVPRYFYFRIYRTHACANIQMFPHSKKPIDLCIHPREPHALDDICLAQKLAIEHEPDDFIRTANGFYGGRWERYENLWEVHRQRSRADIQFPVGVRPPVPGNVVLGEN